MANLLEVASPFVDTRQGHALSDDEQARLAVRRFAAQSSIALVSLGIGRIGKMRAIAEIRQRTRLGRALIAIEIDTIELLWRELRRRRAAATRRRISRL